MPDPSPATPGPTAPTLDLKPVLAGLLRGEALSRDEAGAVFSALLSGSLADAQIGALLALIQTRGPTVDELIGAGRVMRAHVTPVLTPPGATVLDTCGTGGAAKTFNISTAAAVVAAAAAGGKLAIAKHGNRSRSGRGSAEVLRELGVNVDAPPKTQAQCLEACGVCFCFAVHHHPAMRHAAGARAALGFPTIFNLLGPLTNPAGASHQVMGVMGPAYVRPMADALAGLGSARAMVFHSLDGMDELSTIAPTRVAQVEGGHVREWEFDPASLGIAPPSRDDLLATDLAAAARAFRESITAPAGPKPDIVALNAAAALIVGGVEGDWPDALASARRAIASGHAARTLDRLAAVSRGEHPG
ncbi:MAG: anthranilate phosphoribosyltransferase [Phycisphaeraceae bacterium]|nr:MAG: anthranilate phosphoribosyltransferase [Phycisphaeraceae bacterium]